MPFCQHCGGEVQIGWKACPQCANLIVNTPQPITPQIPPTESTSDIIDSIDELLGSIPAIQDSVVMGNVGTTTTYHSSTTTTVCGGCGSSGREVTEYQCDNSGCGNSFCNHCKKTYYEYPRLCNHCAKSQHEEDQRQKDARDREYTRLKDLKEREAAQISSEAAKSYDEFRLQRDNERKMYWIGWMIIPLTLVIAVVSSAGRNDGPSLLGGLIGMIGIIMIPLQIFVFPLVGVARLWWVDEYGNSTISYSGIMKRWLYMIPFLFPPLLLLLFFIYAMPEEEKTETYAFTGIITKEK